MSVLHVLYMSYLAAQRLYLVVIGASTETSKKKGRFLKKNNGYHCFDIDRTGTYFKVHKSRLSTSQVTKFSSHRAVT